jgi:tetratricopeptide (TPR) repeat protein
VTSSISKEEQALALTRVAQVLAWAGKDQEGLRSAKQAVELCPESSAVVSQYGRMLEKNGQTEDAFIQYQAAVRLDSSDSLALSRLAAAFFMKDSIKEARDHWGTAIANTPDSAPLSFRVELHVRVGDCHALLGDREAARKEYLIASRLDPASPLVAERLRR